MLILLLLSSTSFLSFSTFIIFIISSPLPYYPYYYHISATTLLLLWQLSSSSCSRIYHHHVNYAFAIHANLTTITVILITIPHTESSFVNHPLRQQEPQQVKEILRISIKETLPAGYVLPSGSREPIKDLERYILDMKDILRDGP